MTRRGITPLFCCYYFFLSSEMCEGSFLKIFSESFVGSVGGMLFFGWGWSTARCRMKLESFMVEVWLFKKKGCGWCFHIFMIFCLVVCKIFFIFTPRIGGFMIQSDYYSNKWQKTTNQFLLARFTFSIVLCLTVLAVSCIKAGGTRPHTGSLVFGW